MSKKKTLVIAKKMGAILLDEDVSPKVALDALFTLVAATIGSCKDRNLKEAENLLNDCKEQILTRLTEHGWK